MLSRNRDRRSDMATKYGLTQRDLFRIICVRFCLHFVCVMRELYNVNTLQILTPNPGKNKFKLYAEGALQNVACACVCRGQIRTVFVRGVSSMATCSHSIQGTFAKILRARLQSQ